VPSALIIGGRGQCGLAIGGRLRDDGWEVTSTTSRPVPDIAAASGITWKSTCDAPIDELAEDVDVVVHTTAFTRADAAALIALGDRIGSAVVISTLSVYTDTAGRSLDAATDADTFPHWPVPIPEDWPRLEPGDEGYSPQKAAVEALFQQEAPWPVTILRPGAIHGPHSHHLREWYFIKRALDRRPAVVLPFSGQSIFQPTATTNLAELVRLAACNPAHRVLNCGDLEPPTVADISAIIDEVMGWRTERVTVAGPEPSPTVGNHPWAAPRPVIADMQKATTELGYRQPVDYAAAMSATVPWAIDACEDREWRDVFPQLTRYPNLFDYAGEDRYLAGREA
jgi:nucleoside-diphosphate-sugar epimerase